MGQSIIPGVIPISDEHRADPGQRARLSAHTGTDVISYENGQLQPNDPENGQTMQVMTWEEGDRVYLSWDFFDDSNPTSGPINQRVSNVQGSGSFSVAASSNGQTPDPDVVLAYDPRSHELYANLVYISGGQTNYLVARWDYSQRQFDLTSQTPVPLGDVRFKHSYPNIDANAGGLVAVTWQQTVTDVVNINVVSTSGYFPSYTFPQTVTFGRSVLAAGDIRGNFRPCYRDQISGAFGVYVLNPPTGLLEQTLHPDVAISDGVEDDAVISSTFLRHYVDGRGLFSIVNKLAVIQTHYNRCRASDEPENTGANLEVYARHEWPYSENNTLGTPRIAATGLPRNFSNRGTDVEVAIDRTVANCGPYQYEIRNYGKSRGTFRETYTLVSPAGSAPDQPNYVRSVEPAISYSVVIPNRDITKISTTYIISWTGGTTPAQGYDQGDADDIWAVSMNEGEHLGNQSSGPLAQPAGYNRVNYNGGGNQYAPSIAGRYMQGIFVGIAASISEKELAQKLGTSPGVSPNVHLFVDADRQQHSYRRTGDFAGVGGPFQRPAAGATGLLQAYPNPSEGAVTVGLQLHPGERLKQLMVLDALGRPVARLVPPADPAAGVEWKPAATLPAGVYTLRAVTTERTATTTVMRK